MCRQNKLHDSSLYFVHIPGLDSFYLSLFLTGNCGRLNRLKHKHIIVSLCTCKKNRSLNENYYEIPPPAYTLGDGKIKQTTGCVFQITDFVKHIVRPDTVSINSVPPLLCGAEPKTEIDGQRLSSLIF